MERAFAVLQISKSSCKLLINFKSLYIHISPTKRIKTVHVLHYTLI